MELSDTEALMSEWNKHQELMGELVRHSSFKVKAGGEDVVLAFDGDQIFLTTGPERTIMRRICITKTKEGKWLCGAAESAVHDYGDGTKSWRDSRFDKTFEAQDFNKVLSYATELMEFEDCTDRDLDWRDSWAIMDKSVDESVDDLYRHKEPYSQRTFLIPAETSRGYLIGSDLEDENGDKRSEIYKFGLPHELSDSARFWMGITKEKTIECCSRNDVFVVNDTEGGTYAGPLHEVKDSKEMVGDLTWLLSIKEYEIVIEYDDTYETSEERNINKEGAYRGMLIIKGDEYGELKLSVREMPSYNGQKQIRLIQKGHLLDSAYLDEKEYIKNEFEAVRQVVVARCYPQKVRDVLGGFEL